MFYEAILKDVKVSEIVSFITFTVYMNHFFVCMWFVTESLAHGMKFEDLGYTNHQRITA